MTNIAPTVTSTEIRKIRRRHSVQAQRLDLGTGLRQSSYLSRVGRKNKPAKGPSQPSLNMLERTCLADLAANLISYQ